MLKYAKVTNNETKACSVGVGTNEAFYKAIGMTLQDVEQGYDGIWYLAGYAPSKPQSEIDNERIAGLKQLLSDTDYVVIKIAEGSATAEEYAEVIEQRKAWRDEIRKLKGSL